MRRKALFVDCAKSVVYLINMGDATPPFESPEKSGDVQNPAKSRGFLLVVVRQSPAKSVAIQGHIGAYLGAPGPSMEGDAPMALTDVAIRGAKPPAKTTRPLDAGGLYLEMSPAGGRWWRWKYYRALRDAIQGQRTHRYTPVSSVLFRARTARISAWTSLEVNGGPSRASSLSNARPRRSAASVRSRALKKSTKSSTSARRWGDSALIFWSSIAGPALMLAS